MEVLFFKNKKQKLVKPIINRESLKKVIRCVFKIWWSILVLIEKGYHIPIISIINRWKISK